MKIKCQFTSSAGQCLPYWARLQSWEGFLSSPQTSLPGIRYGGRLCDLSQAQQLSLPDALLTGCTMELYWNPPGGPGCDLRPGVILSIHTKGTIRNKPVNRGPRNTLVCSFFHSLNRLGYPSGLFLHLSWTRGKALWQPKPPSSGGMPGTLALALLCLQSSVTGQKTGKTHTPTPYSPKHCWSELKNTSIMERWLCSLAGRLDAVEMAVLPKMIKE